MSKELYHIAPVESMESILKNGILPPKRVLSLIGRGKLSRNVLGLSFDGDDSYFPEYVSLLENFGMAQKIARQICFSRTGGYTDPNFRAICYIIKPEIRLYEGFVNSKKARKMNSNSYNSEALYHGRVSLKLMLAEQLDINPNL